MIRFGIQTALQDTQPDELRQVWRLGEALGFEWISVWDHFGGIGTSANLEAVAMHAALALATERVRVGCLVYSTQYRSPAVLANSARTIDLLSDGRATIGLGTGWLESEFEQWGLVFPSARDRLDRLESTTVALRSLLHRDRAEDPPPTVTQRDAQVTLDGATVDPPPAQARLPIWIGGGGRKRTIPMAGRLADGWNVPMASLDDFTDQVAVLAASEAAADRPPGSVERSVSLGLCWDQSEMQRRYGPRAEMADPAVLTGGANAISERVAAYADVGADWIILSLRAPFHLDELERFAAEVITSFR